MQALLEVDVNYFKNKIKASMKYFSEDGSTIHSDILLRVLKRTFNNKESVFLQQLELHADKDGNVTYDGISLINEFLMKK